MRITLSLQYAAAKTAGAGRSNALNTGKWRVFSRTAALLCAFCLALCGTARAQALTVTGPELIAEEEGAGISVRVERYRVNTTKCYVARVRIDDALRAVNMEQYAKKAPHMLSGGQKQRVAIAGVLAMKPDVIILDESTAMLDPSGRREVMNTVHRLNREEGISVVIITHYMAEAATADYVIVMDEGKIAMSGTPREVFTKVEKMRALGLDVPEMTDLAHMLRGDGVDVRADILTVDEMVEEVCR